MCPNNMDEKIKKPINNIPCPTNRKNIDRMKNANDRGNSFIII